jgi:large subunit ribosomal protein L20
MRMLRNWSGCFRINRFQVSGFRFQVEEGGSFGPARRTMPQVKRGSVRRAKRKKLLARAKGFYQTKSKLYRAAKEAVDTAGKYAYVGRKNKKREYRRLWVVRINAAARENGLTYSQLMRGLKAAGVTLDRKVLADMAATQSAAFAKVAAQAKAALPAEARA